MATVTERPVDLLRYLPQYLQEYVEMYHLITAENPEFKFVANNCKKVLNNTFILYCDKDGIQRFEKILNIVGSDDETLEFRQSRVMINWNDLVPYTLKALTNKLITMQGNNDIQIILDGYKISIITHMDNAGQSDSLWGLFNTMIPCNMEITHKNLVRCNSDGIIFIAAGTNYAQNTTNEFTQHFNSSGTFNVGAGLGYTKISVNDYIQEFTASGSVKVASGISYVSMTANDYVQEFSSQGKIYIASGLNCGRIEVNEFTQQFTSTGKIYLAAGTSEVQMMANDYIQEFTSKGNANLGVGISDTEIIKIY